MRHPRGDSPASLAALGGSRGSTAGPSPASAGDERGRRPVIRVLVVEDQRALAGALEAGISAQPDLECVGAVGTAGEAVTLAATSSPDVVLMDIHLPGTDGIECTRTITAAQPQVRVLILTADPSPARLTEATAAGAAGFLAKDSTFPDILAAIRAPVGGKILVEGDPLKALAAGVLAAGPPPLAPRPDWARLTARERQVLALMGQGLDPSAIAERLVVSLHTARGHVKNIMMKLGAHSQLEAVIVATRAGLLPPPSTALPPR